MPTNFSWVYLDVNIKKRYSSYMNLPKKSFHSILAIDSRLRFHSFRDMWECFRELNDLTDHIAGFDNFIEPSNIVYNIPTPGVDRAVENLKKLLHVIVNLNENVEIRAREMRIKRARVLDEAVETAVSKWCLRCTLI